MRGNVINTLYYPNAPVGRELTYFKISLDDTLDEKHSLQNFPWGDGAKPLVAHSLSVNDTRTKNSTILQRIFAGPWQYSSGNFRFLLYLDGTFIIAKIHVKSTYYYLHNFISIIEEKVHQLLSPKSFIGIKYDFV